MTSDHHRGARSAQPSRGSKNRPQSSTKRRHWPVRITHIGLRPGSIADLDDVPRCVGEQAGYAAAEYAPLQQLLLAAIPQLTPRGLSCAANGGRILGWNKKVLRGSKLERVRPQTPSRTSSCVCGTFMACGRKRPAERQRSFCTRTGGDPPGGRPCRVTTLLRVGTPMSLSSHESGHSTVEGVNHPPWVGHLCHVESRGPDRRDSSSTAAMGRWDTYAQPYSP
jgi:hypothetical protein